METNKKIGHIEIADAVIPARGKLSIPTDTGLITINNGSKSPIAISRILINAMSCTDCEGSMIYNAKTRLFSCKKCKKVLLV